MSSSNNNLVSCIVIFSMYSFFICDNCLLPLVNMSGVWCKHIMLAPSKNTCFFLCWLRWKHTNHVQRSKLGIYLCPRSIDIMNSALFCVPEDGNAIIPSLGTKKDTAVCHRLTFCDHSELQASAKPLLAPSAQHYLQDKDHTLNLTLPYPAHLSCRNILKTVGNQGGRYHFKDRQEGRRVLSKGVSVVEKHF